MSFFNFEDMPESIQEHIKLQHDRVEMSNEVMLRERQRFLDELTDEQAYQFVSLLSSIAAVPPMAFYYIGMIEGRLVKSNWCPTHGYECPNKIAVAEQANKTDDAMRKTGYPAPKTEVDDGFDVANTNKLLALYRVKFTSGKMGVTCNDCGYEYPSLQDRQLRLPGDCPGCEIKAKFG